MRMTSPSTSDAKITLLGILRVLDEEVPDRLRRLTEPTMSTKNKREECQVRPLALLEVNAVLVRLARPDLREALVRVRLHADERDVDCDILPLLARTKQNQIYPIPAGAGADAPDRARARRVHVLVVISSSRATERLPHGAQHIHDRVVTPVFELPFHADRRVNRRTRESTATNTHAVIPPLIAH